MVERHPELDYVLLLEPYSYGLAGKLAYLVRLVRGMYYLQTAGLFVIDNAYLPVHVAPHRPATTVVQVWHAAGALKRLASTRRHRWPSRTDIPPPLLRRGRRRRRVDAGAVRGRPAHADRTRPRRSARRGPTSSSTRGPRCRAGPRPRRPPRAGRAPGRPLCTDVPRPGRRQAAARGWTRRDCEPRCRRTTSLVLKTHPNLDPDATDDGRLRRGRRPDRDINDLLAVDRHPDHRLLVFGRRVRPAPAADHPARRRPRRVRGRSGPLPRLPDRDDRHAGGRHRRDHRAIAAGRFDLSGYDGSSSASSVRHAAGPAPASSIPSVSTTCSPISSVRASRYNPGSRSYSARSASGARCRAAQECPLEDRGRVVGDEDVRARRGPR